MIDRHNSEEEIFYYEEEILFLEEEVISLVIHVFKSLFLPFFLLAIYIFIPFIPSYHTWQ